MSKQLLAAIAATATLVAVPAAQAQDTGNLMVRARAVNLDSANKDGTGVGLSINNKVLPEVDFTYFFSPNLAAELSQGEGQVDGDRGFADATFTRGNSDDFGGVPRLGKGNDAFGDVTAQLNFESIALFVGHGAEFDGNTGHPVNAAHSLGGLLT